MKLVQAIIKPHRLDAVRDSLREAGVQGVTLTEAKGFGRQRGHTEVYRGAEYLVDLVPKLSLEVAIRDEQLEQVVSAVEQAGRTGQIGDGKIFVTDLPDVVRIRTGEHGEEAL